MVAQTIHYQTKMNKKLISIIIIGYILGCHNTSTSNVLVDNVDSIPIKKYTDSVSGTNFNKQEAFCFPDTSVNLKIFLENNKSIFTKGEITLIDYVRENYVAIFLNKSKTEYLLAYQYEGGIENSFSCFEIGFLKDDSILKSKQSIILNEGNFYSESGLRLGMSRDSLISVKGQNYYLDKKDSSFTYRLEMNNSFVMRYNSPGYFIKASFKNNKVNRLTFGFDYP